jgi:hypothetical protein
MASFLRVLELRPVCIAVLDNACDVTRCATLINTIVRGIVCMKLFIVESGVKCNI